MKLTCHNSKARAVNFKHYNLSIKVTVNSIILRCLHRSLLHSLRTLTVHRVVNSRQDNPTACQSATLSTGPERFFSSLLRRCPESWESNNKCPLLSLDSNSKRIECSGLPLCLADLVDQSVFLLSLLPRCPEVGYQKSILYLLIQTLKALNALAFHDLGSWHDCPGTLHFLHCSGSLHFLQSALVWGSCNSLHVPCGCFYLE